MTNNDFNIAEWKKLVDGLFKPNPWIYWGDFLSTLILGYASIWATERYALWSLGNIFFFLVSVFAIYRAVLFVHELTHQDRKDLPGFSIAWNLLVGIPMLIPSFMYRGVHIDHHKKNTFGTNEDGEYIPFGAYPFYRTLGYIAESLILPLGLLVRFLVLAPVSLLNSQLREWVMRRTSALAIRFDLDRKIPPKGIELNHWKVQETLASMYTMGLAMLFITGVLGWQQFVHVYAVIVTIFVVNAVRTLLAHRYLNKNGKELTFRSQLSDSVNIGGNPIIAELVAPVGVRYHALHHVFASMPYHNLYRAHSIIMKHTKPDSVYHQATEPSLWSAIVTHWRNTQSLVQDTKEAPVER